MRPDDVVYDLDTKWGLITTRRTVLTYEKQKLIMPPFIETGKYKEYPSSVVADFIASWCLIHGEYGLRPQKVAEVREKAIKIIYEFGGIWNEELGRPKDFKTLHDVVENGKSWRRPCDFFVLAWASVKMGLQYSNDIVVNESIKRFIQTGDFKYIPAIEINSEYTVSSTEVQHKAVGVFPSSREKGFFKIDLLDVDGPFLSASDVTDAMDCGIYNLETGYERVSVKYIHPEDFALIRPKI